MGEGSVTEDWGGAGWGGVGLEVGVAGLQASASKKGSLHRPLPDHLWRYPTHKPAVLPLQGPAPRDRQPHDHTAPELLWLETRWASLVSFCTATRLLKDILPVGESLNAETVRNHLHNTARRIEDEVANGQVLFIETYTRDWAAIPLPEERITAHRWWLCALAGQEAAALHGHSRQVHACRFSQTAIWCCRIDNCSPLSSEEDQSHILRRAVANALSTR